MPGGPIAGRIWAGRLRVTAPITPEQDFEFICGVVQEAVYFEFLGEHPYHDDRFDLTVGTCDDMVVESRSAVLEFPAVVAFGSDMSEEEGLVLTVILVRDTIEAWYEQPEPFKVSFVNTLQSQAGV